jgi:hypothetical protein
MTTLSQWIRQRAPSLAAIAVGTLSYPIVLGAAWMFWPASAEASTTSDRIAYALQLAAVPALIVLLMITACFRIFDSPGAEDPSSGAESARFKINQRVLSNTIEQAWVFVPLLLALAVRVDASQLRILPIATALWGTGRLLFWAGYHVQPRWRSVGFEWTLFTSVVLACWLAYSFL